MISIEPYRLSEAVSAIYPDIEKRVAARKPTLDERCLWYELSCCLLSSQVPYPLAVAAADAIDMSRLLLDEQISESALALELNTLLVQRLNVESRQRAYRFPRIRANQLAATRQVVTQASGSLECLLASFRKPSDTRSWLVQNTPGIGPKQASMFLRNICLSYDLAIIDRHVIDYMTVLGYYSKKIGSISHLANYQRQEKILVRHALEMDVKVGLLDWAIWIVMRAARSSGYAMV